MVQSYIFLFVTVTSIIWKISLGLVCFSCHSESDRSRCLTHQVECRDGLEECFFDKSTLQNSAVVYSAGCRAKGVCDLLANAVGKRDDISRSRRTSVLCAQCCNTAAKNRIPCNAHLCSDRLTCLSCDSAADITKCLNSKMCQQADEECYFDKIIQPDLSTVFSAGCRSKQVCNLISSAVGKRNVNLSLIRSKKDTVACAQCCNTQPDSSGVPCNGGLCDQHLSFVSSDTCGVCSHVSRPSDCTVFQSCQPNEVCKVNTVFTGGRIVHELGCELKTVCDAFLKEYKLTHNGKRADHGSLVLCSVCCTGKNCNTKGDCKTLLPTSSVSYDTCGVCDHVSRPSDCTVFQSCQPTEVCKLNRIFSGGIIIHELGCELKTVCDVMLREYKATHHGKRADLGSLVLCSACCTGKNCNTKGDCRTLFQNQPCFNSTTCG